MTDTATAPHEARLRPAAPARAAGMPVPAPGPFDADGDDAAGTPRTLSALGTMLLVLYPACASVLVVVTAVVLAGPAQIA